MFMYLLKCICVCVPINAIKENNKKYYLQNDVSIDKNDDKIIGKKMYCSCFILNDYNALDNRKIKI